MQAYVKTELRGGRATFYPVDRFGFCHKPFTTYKAAEHYIETILEGVEYDTVPVSGTDVEVNRVTEFGVTNFDADFYDGE